MDPPASGRRGRKRPRHSESEGNQQHQPNNASVWGQDTTVRGTDHDTASHHPTYSSHVDVSRLSSQVPVTDPSGLMNGYATAPHSQYPSASSSLAHAPNDVNGLAGQPSVQTPQSAQRRNNNVGATVHQPTVALDGNTTLNLQQQQNDLTAFQQQDNRVLYFNGAAPTPVTTSIAEAASAAVSPAPSRSYAGLSNVVASWASPIPTADSTPTSHTNPNESSGGNGLMAQSPGPGAYQHQHQHPMQAPQGAIYDSFEDLLKTVQAAAKEQGFSIVKLRASNYRNNKATRYDLVCDRGGVKYNSTAKKRNPSTRKIDCPWKAKAVCEVQLNNQWRFSVQEGHHNHEPRVPTSVSASTTTAAVVAAAKAAASSSASAAAGGSSSSSSAAPAPGHTGLVGGGGGGGGAVGDGGGGSSGGGGGGSGSSTSVSHTLRSIANKLDRLSHDVNANVARIENNMELRFEGFEKRIEALEALVRANVELLGGNPGGPGGGPGGPGGGPGGGGLANGPLSNGGMGGPGGMGNGLGNGLGNGGLGNGLVDGRMSNLESRVGGLEQVGGMDMSLMDDDPSSRRLPLL